MEPLNQLYDRLISETCNPLKIRAFLFQLLFKNPYIIIKKVQS
jgi:hypothetical protein